MSNRLVLGAFDNTYVLRISRPGYDVLDTGLTVDQLVFDSRWQSTGNVIMKGQISFVPTNGATVSFGRTFDVTPLVFTYRMTGSNQLNPTADRLEVYTDRFVIPTFGTTTDSYTYYYIVVSR